MSATLSAETMAVVAPPGDTWDAEGNEEAVVRTPQGLANYSERNFKVSKPEPKPKPKKKHKRFTSPAPKIGDEGVEAYQEKLKSLLDTALPVEPAPMASSQSEGEPERDGVQEYGDALKALAETTTSEPAQGSMAPPPRPRDKQERQDTPEPPHASTPPPSQGERSQERQDTQEPEQPPSFHEQTWEWKHFCKRYHGYRYRRDRPTTCELAKVIVVPKRPSRLSQVHNAESDDSTIPSSNPPPTPLPRLFSATHGLLTPGAILDYMNHFDNRPASGRPLPRAKTSGLEIFYRAPPESAVVAPAAAAPQYDVKILHWRISKQMRDLSFLLELVGALNAPPL